jgi:hypothetical protein
VPQPIAMHPWYKDFAGTISPVPEKVKKGEQPTVGGPTSYHITGVVEQLSDTALKISELPVRPRSPPPLRSSDRLPSQRNRVVDRWVRG